MNGFKSKMPPHIIYLMIWRNEFWARLFICHQQRKQTARLMRKQARCRWKEQHIQGLSNRPVFVLIYLKSKQIITDCFLIKCIEHLYSDMATGMTVFLSLSVEEDWDWKRSSAWWQCCAESGALCRMESSLFRVRIFADVKGPQSYFLWGMYKSDKLVF